LHSGVWDVKDCPLSGSVRYFRIQWPAGPANLHGQ
jgi:hypothetical protein